MAPNPASSGEEKKGDEVIQGFGWIPNGAKRVPSIPHPGVLTYTPFTYGQVTRITHPIPIPTL